MILTIQTRPITYRNFKYDKDAYIKDKFEAYKTHNSIKLGFWGDGLVVWI